MTTLRTFSLLMGLVSVAAGASAQSDFEESAFLRQQADADHSGFVSTKEGYDLRRLVEMGLVADQLKLRSAEELERALPANASEADLAAYAALRAEAMKQGLEGLPALSNGLAPSPQALK